MVKDENKIILKGNVGQDARISTVGQSQVANFSLAVKKSWKDKSGEWKYETTWFNIVAWQGYGVCDFNLLTKGQKVYIEGEMRNREYITQDNEKRSIWEVVASSVDIILDKPITSQNQPQNMQNASFLRQQEDTDW